MRPTMKEYDEKLLLDKSEIIHPNGRSQANLLSKKFFMLVQF